MSSSMYPQPTAAQRIQQQWLQQKSRPTTTEVNIKPQIQTAAPPSQLRQHPPTKSAATAAMFKNRTTALDTLKFGQYIAMHHTT
ncbi:hypothetical protein [Xylella fastidiosa]|uniref:hypothetical protein n=1 Tax=Xylella fastidiosa TaxID=2371 RepID=UPI001AE0B4A8|nr:hypothetical protein [Xylella fastidiosa]